MIFIRAIRIKIRIIRVGQNTMNKTIKFVLISFLLVASLVLAIVIKFNIDTKSLSSLKNNINNMEKIIKKSTLAGSFFPAEEEELNALLNNFLNNTENKNYQDIRAIIVPHAGLVYSGQTAAHAYQQLADKEIDKIILLGPAHHQYIDKLALMHADYWNTPLGKIELDNKLIYELEKNINFTFFDQAFVQENSLETQLPFIKKILPSAKLVPIALGVLNDEQIQSASASLLNIIDENTILIISTDLSHYYPQAEAQRIDQICLDSIKNLKFNSECEACGEMGLKILFQIAQKLNWQAEILDYSHSGEITGDEKVVGYGSAILTGKVNNLKTKEVEKNYSKEDKQYLLKLARETIEYAFENNRKQMPIIEKGMSDKLTEERGVFVTLHKNEKLRGCIGYIQPIEKLYQAVQKNALSAAFNDPRFNPLEKNELPNCEIEISILSVPKKTTLNNIQPNTDGVILKQGSNQATYLPQVWEDISGPAEFYGSLCIKAGLQADCYTDEETEFYKYQAEVFSE